MCCSRLTLLRRLQSRACLLSEHRAGHSASSLHTGSFSCDCNANIRTLGIIGGVGPESTVEYYRTIIALYRERVRDGSYPQFVINSIDLQKEIALISANDLEGATKYLLEELQKLAL